jgi:hypothetical protein
MRYAYNQKLMSDGIERYGVITGGSSEKIKRDAIPKDNSGCGC